MNHHKGLQKRRKRIRRKLHGMQQRPRVSVFRSNKYIYAYIINDDTGTVLGGCCEHQLPDTQRKGTKIERAHVVGVYLSKLLKKRKISKIVFDRSGYLYHGRVKALADGIRENAIDF